MRPTKAGSATGALQQREASGMSGSSEVLVFGRTGQVAQELAKRAPGLAAPLRLYGRETLDLLTEDPGRLIRGRRPRAVINAAAHTAVDRAESEESLALRLNAEVVGAMARACAEQSIPFIHISTDYVFDGSKPEPYVESDPTGPLGVYGRTKLEGEMQVMAAGGSWTIFRTAWVFSAFGANFVKTMVRLGGEREDMAVVSDQHGRPTHAGDIADLCLRAALDPGPSGLYHLAGADDAVWADVADHVFEALNAKTGRRPRLRRIPTAEYPTPAKRPVNSRLDTSKLQALTGFRPRPWRETVDLCLQDLSEL